MRVIGASDARMTAECIARLYGSAPHAADHLGVALHEAEPIR